MIISIVIMGITLGFFISLVVFDFKDRKALFLKLLEAEAKALDAGVKLAQAQNNIVSELKALGDRVATHEFALRAKQTPDMGLGGKRF